MRVGVVGATGQVGTIDKAIFNEELLILGEDGVQFFDPNKLKAYKISGPSWVNNHAHVLKCTNVNQTFLENYLNFHDLNPFISGGTRGKLTKGVLENINVVLPTEFEQKKIAQILGSVDDQISKTEEII